MATTEKQKQALLLLKIKKRVLLFGGARSGKTYITIKFVFFLAMKYPNSKHLIARKFQVDVRQTVWKTTIVQMITDLDLVVGRDVDLHEQAMEIRFLNGSVIMCSGLDDKERVDKILGTEYTTIYLNEIPDIPWSTVAKVRTRLSQRSGTLNRLICDLNPTSVEHWSYKWFISKIDPSSLVPLSNSDDMAFLQMNPTDNAENLPTDYIIDELESLSGNDRNRFLLGEYSANTDLRVFSPKSLYQSWDEFTSWVNGRWPDVKLVGGIDIGYRDADAVVVIAFIPGERDAWVVWEHKARRQTIEELAAAVKRAVLFCDQNVPGQKSSPVFYADTATVRYGKEFDGKKTASELARNYGLPIQPAHKRDKAAILELLQNEINSGYCHLPFAGVLADESIKTVWRRNEVSGAIERRIDDDVFHPDAFDALRYPYAWLFSYGNPIFRPNGFSVRDKHAIDRRLDVNFDNGKYW